MKKFLIMFGVICSLYAPIITLAELEQVDSNKWYSASDEYWLNQTCDEKVENEMYVGSRGLYIDTFTNKGNSDLYILKTKLLTAGKYIKQNESKQCFDDGSCDVGLAILNTNLKGSDNRIKVPKKTTVLHMTTAEKLANANFLYDESTWKLSTPYHSSLGDVFNYANYSSDGTHPIKPTYFPSWDAEFRIVTLYSSDYKISTPEDNKAIVECQRTVIRRCGDGILDTTLEECDPAAPGWDETTCNPVNCKKLPVCSSFYSGQELTDIVDPSKLCTEGTVKNFKYDEATRTWTWECEAAGTGVECSAKKRYNGTWEVEKTLVSETKYITKVGQELVWEIKVTAKNGDLKDMKITDKLPPVLDYVSYSVVKLPSGITIADDQPTFSSDRKNVYWQTKGDFKNGETIILRVVTKANAMPKVTDNYKNVACASPEGEEDKCDDEPVKTEGALKIEKTLTGKVTVQQTGEVLTWDIKVTALGGDVDGFEIKDFVPSALQYMEYKVTSNPDNLTVKGPTGPVKTSTGNVYTWSVSGVLQSGHSLLLTVKTEVIQMPKAKDDHRNVACVVKDDNKDCDDDKPGNPALRIKKSFTDGTKEKTVKIGDEIAYKITFGNSGNAVATITSIKDFLPKNVGYVSSSIFVNGEKIHTNVESGSEIINENKRVDGVFVDIYGGITLKPGEFGHIILTGKVLTGNQDNRTNFACIYLNDEKVDCDDVVHNFTGEVMCKSDIKSNDSADLCNGISWTVPVTCNSDGGTADTIEILCDGQSLKREHNISELRGDCVFSSDGDHTVKCEVNGGTVKVANNCEGVYNLKHHSCSSGCFPAGTKVKMADGTSKSIEKVEAGDVVLSYNTDTDNNEKNVVKQIIVHENNMHEMYELTINGEILKVTDVHPFYVRKSVLSRNYAWIEAQNLKVGDILLMNDGSLVKIEKINHYPNKETVYNLEVEGNHDYFVDKGYLVHNKGGTTTCFVAGTKVTMADGSQKNIEDVKIGEKVLGSNGTVNTVLGYDRPVLGDRHLWSINGSKYFVSDEHPFKTTEGWKSFNPEMTKLEVDLDTTELRVGDILITNNGLEEIKTVDYIDADYNTPLYNLMLDGDHTYYANDYLVHNKCTGECCGGGCGGNDATPYCEENEDDPICELANPHCFNVNEGNFSIELGEFLPFYFNVYRNKEDSAHTYKFVGEDEENEVCELGEVDLGSLKCRYVIRKPATTADRTKGKDIVFRSNSFDCLSLDDRSNQRNENLIKNWINEQKNEYEVDIDDYAGRYWPMIQVAKSEDWVGIKDTNGENILGEYQFQIEVYKYRQCTVENEKWANQPIKEIDKPNIGVCQSNFVLTEPYTVQKTPSGNLTASTKTLSNFKQVDGVQITPFSSYLDAIATSEYHSNQKVDGAMDTFIKKYEKLAVTVKESNGKILKKVPGKNIYFVKGDITPSNIIKLDKPATFVQTEGDTIIDGNVNNNIMILTKHNIRFIGDCTKDQTVKGIFYAKGNLIRTGVDKNNNIHNKVWCTKGGLHIKGVLIGDNFNDLMKNSRSHLDTWFKRDGSRSTTDTQKLKTKIMNGASVLIEYSPSIFNKSTMPPGAEDFTTALSIYKQ